MAGTKKLLVRGGQVYDHDGDVHHPAVADILIEDGEIVAVGANLQLDGVHEVIDASGRLVVPGLINAHYHSHDTLCRGLFEELPLEMWLLYTLPMGANRSKEEVRARTLVGALESSALRHHHRAGHAGPSPLNDEYTDVVIGLPRGRHSRRVLADGLRRAADRHGPPQGQPARRRPGDARHQARCRCASSSTISSISSSAIRRAARCTGRWRRLRRSAARRRCCKAAPRSRTSTISPSTPTSMKRAARH